MYYPPPCPNALTHEEQLYVTSCIAIGALVIWSIV